MNIQKLFNKALQNLQIGKMDEGEKLLIKIIKINPTHYPSLTNLGTLYLIKKKSLDGIKFLERSISIHPNQPVALCNLGGFFYEMKNFQKSIYFSQLAIRFDNNQIKAKINLGHAYKKIGNISQSLKYYLEIDSQYYKDENLVNNLLDNLIILKKYKEAIALIKMNEFKSNSVLFLKSICLKEMNEIESAINLLKQISQDEENDEYLIELMDLIYQKNGYENSLNYINENYESDKFIIKFIIGKINYYEKNYECALSIFKECLHENPYHIDTSLYIAYIYTNTQQYDLAIKEYKKIESSKDKLSSDRNFPEAMMNLGSLYLFLGDYESGWNYYQQRFNTSKMGVDIKNHYSSILVNPGLKQQRIEENTHLLLLQEQGIGDLLIYIRSVKDNIHRFKKITLACDSRLFNIIKQSIPEIYFLDYKKEIELNDFDSYDYIGNFCARYYRDIHAVNGKPFINGNIIENKNSTLRVGLSWKSKNKSYKNKSTRLNNFLPILKNTKLEVLCLQYGDVNEEINEILTMGGRINQAKIDLYNDIDGITKEIAACDLIITTSNVTAHLAGAIGKKTYLLVPSTYNDGRIWYWTNGYHKNKTPWYESIIIYEIYKDDWIETIKKINNELVN